MSPQPFDPKPRTTLRLRTLVLAVAISLAIWLAGLIIVKAASAHGPERATPAEASVAGYVVSALRRPHPIKAPTALIRERAACTTLQACKNALARAYAALEWAKKERQHLHAKLLDATRPVKHSHEWLCIHGHEGAWNDATGNGYYGGLQMDRPFMETYGRDMIQRYHGYANQWPPRAQMIVAERAYEAGRGYNPWPNTARACGLL